MADWSTYYGNLPGGKYNNTPTEAAFDKSIPMKNLSPIDSKLRQGDPGAQALWKKQQGEAFKKDLGGKNFNDLNVDQLMQMKDLGLLDGAAIDSVMKMKGQQAAQAKEAEMKATQIKNVQTQFLNGKDPTTLTPTERAELDRRSTESLTNSSPGTDGKPAGVNFNYLTKLDGSLQDQFKLGEWNNVNPDRTALDNFAKTANRQAGEASPWAKIQQEKLGVDRATNLDNVGKTSAQSLLSAQSQLAQSGGLSGAARERMALNTSRDAAMGKQGVMRNSQLDQLNLSSTDEQNRMSGLKDLQGMNNTLADVQFKNQQAATDINKYNTQNLLNENTQKRAFDSNQYNQAMSAWGAGKSADAQRAAAGGGGKK